MKLNGKHSNMFADPEDWVTDDKLMLLECWARDGFTFKDIADRIGITDKQLGKWRREYPEITEALNNGREIIDYKVENSLLKAALGYRTKEVTVITTLRNGKTVENTIQTVTKDVPPNVNACQTWLYNRRPDKWRNMNGRNSLIDELSDKDSSISITVTRASKNGDKDTVVETEEDKEWQDSINTSVTLKKNEETAQKQRKTKQKDLKTENHNDLDYWPDDWEDEDED